MGKQQFKAESKKLMDMMINSIYTHKEIFLRELISNASDALDKLYYQSLTSNAGGHAREDYKIMLDVDAQARTLTITDNGCGMSKDDLDNNLGTIAKSGSLDFKSDMEKTDDVEIIGQFGVGFYSAFMVSDKITVLSRSVDSDEAYLWESTGVDGYTITEAQKAEHGTVITLYLKESSEEVNYDEYLNEYGIRQIVSKYSDYIRYPIMMETEKQTLVEGSEDEYETTKELEQLNSMVPLWRKNKNEITDEEYKSFYQAKFYDYTAPAKVIHSKTEGQISYDALMYIPKQAPFDYYSKDFEKGLQLYSNGVLIMEKCSDLLPDYFSFVKGLVDSSDLTLNISRETLQQDHIVKLIAKNVQKKITAELKKMLKNERETYEEFFSAFGSQLKFGIYNDYGVNKDLLKELIMFHSSHEDKNATLSEYVSRMGEEQSTIYYACGETTQKIDLLPQADTVKSKGFELLYCTENVDEFALQVLAEYEGKTFTNICTGKDGIDTEEEKEELKKANEDSGELLEYLTTCLEGEVKAVRLTNKLKNHPVCLTSEGALTLEMEKVLAAMPDSQGMKATLILEINANHKIAQKVKDLYQSDKDMLKKYVKVLYGQGCLIAGKDIANPAEFSEYLCEIM
ncbi:MAG: molecular chaperone HtpG [Clostridia bacterium]